MAAAVHGIARPGDVIAVSETAVAIAQNRMIAAETVRPSRLAYALARRAGALATVNQPESLQLVIDPSHPLALHESDLLGACTLDAGRRMPLTPSTPRSPSP